MSAFKGAYFSSGSSSDAVYWAQKALNNLGYSDASNVQLPLDGKLTENTQYAITQFQQKSGLNPTGALDAKTLSLLNKPFQLNGKNLLYGNFGEEIKQTEVVNVAENMLSTMKPNTMVEIPYRIVATSVLNDSSSNGIAIDQQNEKGGTNGDGLNITLMAGPRISITCQHVTDTQGNEGTLFSVALGGGLGVSASASYTHTDTNAESIDDLTGISTETGGSLSVGPIGGNYEYIIGKNYTGANYGISAGLSPINLPIIPELHSDVSYSFLVNSDKVLLQYYADNGMTDEVQIILNKIFNEYN